MLPNEFAKLHSVTLENTKILEICFIFTIGIYEPIV
jgi:hypothetical protein